MIPKKALIDIYLTLYLDRSGNTWKEGKEEVSLKSSIGTRLPFQKDSLFILLYFNLLLYFPKLFKENSHCHCHFYYFIFFMNNNRVITSTVIQNHITEKYVTKTNNNDHMPPIMGLNIIHCVQKGVRGSSCVDLRYFH